MHSSSGSHRFPFNSTTLNCFNDVITAFSSAHTALASSSFDSSESSVNSGFFPCPRPSAMIKLPRGESKQSFSWSSCNAGQSGNDLAKVDVATVAFGPRSVKQLSFRSRMRNEGHDCRPCKMAVMPVARMPFWYSLISWIDGPNAANALDQVAEEPSSKRFCPQTKTRSAACLPCFDADVAESNKA